MKIFVVLLVLSAFIGIVTKSYAETELHEGDLKLTRLGKTKGKYDHAKESTDLGGKAIKGDRITAKSFADVMGKGSQSLAVGYASAAGNNPNSNPNSVSGSSNNNNKNNDNNMYDIDSHHTVTWEQYGNIIRNQPKRP